MCNHFEYDVEELISLIEQRPVLWDRTSEIHKDRSRAKEAWLEICANFKPDFDKLIDREQNEICKILIKKWTNLRDAWMRTRRKQKALQTLGMSHKKIKKYVYDQELQFLNKLQTETDTLTNFDDMLNETDIFAQTNVKLEARDPFQEIYIPTSQPCDIPNEEKHYIAIAKRKREVDDEPRMENSEIDMESNRHMCFFKGILPSVVEFNDDETIEFQMGVLQLIKDMKQRKASNTFL